jgi:hypothetical protein
MSDNSKTATDRQVEVKGDKSSCIHTVQQCLNAENIALYRDVFRGRDDVVPSFWKSKRGDKKSGYSFLCHNKWDQNLCNLKKKIMGGKCSTCQNVKYTPLSNDLIERHISGGKDSIIGVYPLLKDHTCHFIAADFDKHKPSDPDPWNEVENYLDTCAVLEIPAYVLRSKSGNGYHVFIFFSEAVEAWKARAMAFALLREAGIVGDDVDISTFDRLLPNQARLSGKGLGNLISLPFQGGAGLRGNTLFLNPETNYKEPFPDQWETLRTLSRFTPAALDTFIKGWDLKKEAPPERKRPQNFKYHSEKEAKGVFSRIKNGCKFMSHWCLDAEDLTEPEWYAGLTIIVRCKDGRRQAHKWSAAYVGYSEADTDQKIEHAYTDTGPYLCKTIQDRINGAFCKSCPHRGKVSTPLLLGEQATHDDIYVEVMRDMNKKHAVIQIGGHCCILNEIIDPIFNRPDISLSSPADKRNQYANNKIADPHNPNKQISIFNFWFEHPDRKEFDGMVFDPSLKAPPSHYNLFRGFAVEPAPGDWSLFRDHIVEVIAGGKQSIAEYVLAWLARMFQDPGGKRPGTSIVLRGKQGTGKGIFVNTIGEILGRHYFQIAQAGQIMGRFNSHLKDVILAFIDEGFWAGDKQAEGTLKNMITEPFITIEQKGKDIIKVKNNVNLIIASNNDRVIPAGLEERRFVFLDVADIHQQDHDYFKAIALQMKNGGVEAMLHDLLAMDISGVNLREVEQTRGLFEQKLSSMNTVQKYWLERLSKGTLRSQGAVEFDQCSKYSPDPWSGWILASQQYDDFLEFAETLHDRFPLCDQQFGIALQKMCSGVKKNRRRMNGGRPYIRTFPPLEECRAEFERLVKTKIEWDRDEPEEVF